MKDESGEQFVAYFLPTEETMTKRDTDRETGQWDVYVCGLTQICSVELNWYQKQW